MTDLYATILVCAAIILLGIWFCTHLILRGQEDLAAKTEQLRRILSIYVDYVDLAAWRRSEEGLQSQSRSRL